MPRLQGRPPSEKRRGDGSSKEGTRLTPLWAEKLLSFCLEPGSMSAAFVSARMRREIRPTGRYEVLGLMHAFVRQDKVENVIARQNIVEVTVKN